MGPQPWVRESIPYLQSWIAAEGIDPASVARVIEGVDLSASGDIPPDDPRRNTAVFIPGLTAAPWWDSDLFPWISQLEAASAKVVKEFEEMRGMDTGPSLQDTSGRADIGQWTARYLYYMGRPYPKNIAACPETMRVLGPILGNYICGMTYFSIMHPNTHVVAHSGYLSAHLRCHLGLVVPGQDARMRVAEETRRWREGKVVVFDDSFDHEVWNDCDAPRAVLLFDIWHPDLTELEIRALSHLMAVWRKLFYRNFILRSATAAQPRERVDS